jgi:hypothetical protein
VREVRGRGLASGPARYGKQSSVVAGVRGDGYGSRRTRAWLRKWVRMVTSTGASGTGLGS